MAEENGFFSKIPTFNASVARFITLFYIALVFLLISEGQGIVGKMLQHYYQIPDGLVETSVLHITTTIMLLVAMAGISWALHKMVPVLPFNWLRIGVHVGNLLLHVINLVLFVMVMLVVFLDIPSSFMDKPCPQGVIACSSYLEE